MTLVLTSINAASVVQASDRLTTRVQRGRPVGEHDALANKTVVYLATDGPMVISFSGIAYVRDEPTDDWIARQLAGSLPNRMPDGRIPAVSFRRLPSRSFNQAVWRLQQAIAAEPVFNAGIEVAIGGWRVRRRRLAQTLLGVVRTKDGTHREGHMRLRTKGFGGGLLSTGVIPDLAQLRSSMRTHPDQRALALDPATQSALLADTIVRTSQSYSTVGADVMAVEIPRWRPEGPRKVTIRYRPGTERYAALVGNTATIPFPAAFWPWIVTPMGIKAPTVSSGGTGSITEFCGWEFVHETSVPPAVNGLLFAESSMSRPGPPR